jgi:hypothetical protein
LEMPQLKLACGSAEAMETHDAERVALTCVITVNSACKPGRSKVRPEMTASNTRTTPAGKPSTAAAELAAAQVPREARRIMTRTERMFVFGSLGILIGDCLHRIFPSLPVVHPDPRRLGDLHRIHPAQRTMTRSAVTSIALLCLVGPHPGARPRGSGPRRGWCMVEQLGEAKLTHPSRQCPGRPDEARAIRQASRRVSAGQRSRFLTSSSSAAKCIP